MIICEFFIIIDLMFGAAGLNVVTKGKNVFSCFCGLGFNDALLFSNLISASVLFIVVLEKKSLYC